MRLLTALGQDVDIRVSTKPRNRVQGRIRVIGEAFVGNPNGKDDRIAFRASITRDRGEPPCVGNERTPSPTK